MKKLGLLCLIVALLALPMSAMALEKMSGEDMGSITGQAGVTIAFGGNSTTTITFSQLAWGDPDGFGNACGQSAGWLIIAPDSAGQVISITQSIVDGDMLTLDIGTNADAASSCDVSGTDAVIIPADTTFIAVGLPTISTAIAVPDTLVVGLGQTSQAIGGTLGLLNLKGLTITQVNPNTLYIWAH